jgi:hypothetical protein
MKKKFEGFLFNRLELIGGEKFNHVGCEGNNEEFIDFLIQFVPEVGSKRKVTFTVESKEEIRIIGDYKNVKKYVEDKKQGK